ncbi:glutaredoxin-2-fold [Caudoviricetes sp.]|nr:glutaredoxin-2-fold [Caudoviricetes sp.]
MSNWCWNCRRAKATFRFLSRKNNRERKTRKKKGRSSVPGTVPHALNAANDDRTR